MKGGKEMIEKKRLLPILMAVLMVFAMMPLTAGAVYAEDLEPITVINECGDDGNAVIISNADGESVSNVPAGTNIVITFTGGQQLDPDDPNYDASQGGGDSSGRPVYMIITANADGSVLFNDVVGHNQMESIMVPAGGITIKLTYGGEESDTCTVTFDANGGTLADGDSGTISAACGETITLPAAERTGFIFEGWYDGDTKIGVAGDSYTVSDNRVLQAHWKEAPFVILCVDWYDTEQKVYLDEDNCIIDQNSIPPIGTEVEEGIVVEGYYSDIEYTKQVDVQSRIPDELIGKKIYIKLTAENVVIYVQGVEVTKENRTDVLGDKTVSFDYDTMTLTLKNADITDIDEYPAVGIGQYTPVTIRLEGENTITGNYLQEENIYGIISYSRLKICGPGSLDVSMENTGGTYVYGIYSIDLTVSADLDIKFSAGTGGYQCGIAGNKIVFDNSSTTITALKAEDGPVAYGIGSEYGGVTLKGDSDIKVASNVGISLARISDRLDVQAGSKLELTCTKQAFENVRLSDAAKALGVQIRTSADAAAYEPWDGTTDLNSTDIKCIKIPGKEISHVKAKQATCGEKGNTEYWTVTENGNTRYYSDAGLSHEIDSLDEVRIPATGKHTYKDIVTKATLTRNGKIIKKCSVCGDVGSTTTIYYQKNFQLSAAAYTYDGKVKKPSVTLKDANGKKIASTNYTVTYKNNKNVGKASAVVTLKGNYSGSKTVTFKINPKGTSLSKVTKAKKAATVKWKKQSSKMSSSRITGYQIQLAMNSKFTKNKKTVTVNGYSKTSKKVTGLKGGKKYWVKIRTYKTVNGTKYYSPWSKVKTVKTKK